MYPTSLPWEQTQSLAWGTNLTSSWWRLTRNTQDSSMWVRLLWIDVFWCYFFYIFKIMGSIYMIVSGSVLPYILMQMKAVAGMKMSYSLQQAINLSRKTIIRGFRQDETHSALCSHLFTMIRGNRQHRRAFLISLLNLFDDSAVSHNLSFSVNISWLKMKELLH